MTRTTDPLEPIGADLAAAQDRQLEDVRAALDESRAQNIAALVRGDVRPRARARARARTIVVIGGVAAAALAAGLVLGAVLGPWWRDLGGAELPAGDGAGDAPGFVVDGTGAAGRVGEAIEAAPGAERTLRFGDGTSLRLEAAGRARPTRARVEALDAAGARVVLEEGAIAAAVVHRPGARWTVAAGPFDVHVVGTRFHVAWSASSSLLDLTLDEGAVVVDGPLLGAGRPVKAGETLHVDVGAGRVSAALPAAATSAALDGAPRATAGVAGAPGAARATAGGTGAADAPGAVGAARKPAPPHAGAGATAAAGAHATGAATAAAGSAAPAGADALLPGWRALADARAYVPALAAAREEGFERLCLTLPAPDLGLLADVARRAGSGPAAGSAYEALRRRFPGGAAATEAAFRLARLWLDSVRGAPEAAVRSAAVRVVLLLEEYLRDAPDGTFASEAAGRLIEARRDAGDLAGARAAASSYLARYPGGPSAGIARALLAKP